MEELNMKKLISIICIVSMICAMLIPVGATASAETGRNANMNDVLNILKHLAVINELTETQKAEYDFFDNGDITILNALKILKGLAGISEAVTLRAAPPAAIGFSGLIALANSSSGNFESDFTILDAMNILKVTAGFGELTEAQIAEYDFFDNGEITVYNAVAILKALVGIIDSPKAGSLSISDFDCCTITNNEFISCAMVA
jgi:hypothetical protein